MSMEESTKMTTEIIMRIIITIIIQITIIMEIIIVILTTITPTMPKVFILNTKPIKTLLTYLMRKLLTQQMHLRATLLKVSWFTIWLISTTQNSEKRKAFSNE
jgi:hypothetical protein